MSLVLEALKKADAERERERGAVPDLHARPVPLAPSPASGRRTGGPLLAWTVAGVAVAAAGALGWQVLRRPAPEVVAPAPQQPPVSPVVATAPPAAAVQPDPVPAPAPVPGPAPAPARAPVPAPAPAPAPAPTPSPAPVPPPPRQAQAPAPVPMQAPPPAPSPPPVSATAPAPRPAPAGIGGAGNEERIYDTMQALPDNIRQAIPRMSMGGAMYSESPANRMLIVNGQLFRENDELSPGLVLEQIALRSAVLRYRNYRFRVSY